MDITGLKKNELLNLKTKVDSQLERINKVDNDKLANGIESSKNKKSLSDLDDDNQVFCMRFSDSKVRDMDYVNLSFSKGGSDEFTSFIATNSIDTIHTIGCSSDLKSECLDNYYFLSEFTGSMFFFTLKPENWKDDLKSELSRLIKQKEVVFSEDIAKFEKKVNGLINNSDVDGLILQKTNNYAI